MTFKKGVIDKNQMSLEDKKDEYTMNLKYRGKNTSTTYTIAIYSDQYLYTHVCY